MQITWPLAPRPAVPAPPPRASSTAPQLDLWPPPSSGFPRPWSWLIYGVLAAGVVGYVCVFAFSLIAQSESKLVEDSPSHNPRFLRLSRDVSLKRRTRELPKKRPLPPPDSPAMSFTASPTRQPTATDLRVDLPTSTVASNVAFSGVALMGNPGVGTGTVVKDRDYMPFARVRPMYPPDAHRREIEGWVDLVFTVNARGSVEDVRVLRSKPRGVFNREAIKAVRKWKYRPKVRNGKARSVRGVKARINFKLEDR